MNKIRSILLLCALILLNSILFGQTSNADFDYFTRIEFNDKIVESRTDDNQTTFQKIVIDGFDSKIPFYHIKPKQKKDGKYIFLLHGLTGSKEGWINSTNGLYEKYVKIKDTLLTLGYTVIIPDAKYHGERSYEANFASPTTFFPTQDTQKAYNLFSTTVKDLRIIMDYIQSSNPNTEISFDVIGYSMGGMMTVLLNSVEERLNRVVVCVAPMDTHKASIRIGMNEVNARKMEFISPKNFAHLQKAPVTLLMGTKDGWYVENEARDFFNSITIEDKTLKFYESGHFLPDEFIQDAIEGVQKN